MLTKGPIPENHDEYHGTVVMHTCDNRLCCNPSHLRLGTQAENVKDMSTKGRWGDRDLPKGERHHNSRFTEADIRYIRASNKRNVDLAKEYDCHRGVIGNIRRKTTWKHIN